MIRMSKLTDYGIVLMVYAARAQGSCTTRQLAQYSELPVPTVSKILKELTRRGFLTSSRGAHGGYALARQPDAILVGELIEALEGPIALTECSAVQGDGLCEHEAYCPLRTPWTMINKAVRQALHGIRLSDMTDPSFRLPSVAS